MPLFKVIVCFCQGVRDLVDKHYGIKMDPTITVMIKIINVIVLSDRAVMTVSTCLVRLVGGDRCVNGYRWLFVLYIEAAVLRDNNSTAQFLAVVFKAVCMAVTRTAKVSYIRVSVRSEIRTKIRKRFKSCTNSINTLRFQTLEKQTNNQANKEQQNKM